MFAYQSAQRTPFELEILEGLSRIPKTLPSKWLYDERGSELFEEITRLPEYYPTRTETAILKAHAEEMTKALGRTAALVEYGAGASIKSRIVIDALDSPLAYIPIDVSADFLSKTADGLKQDYPALYVIPVVANFLDEITLPELVHSADCIGFFPGSTIGNLSDLEIRRFLNRARQSLGAGSHFILGFDLRKSPDILVPAYDDAQGVTAAFNLNLLVRINRELGADFNIGQFSHEARWNDELSRIEMHLVSKCAQRVKIAGHGFEFAESETIHTENSRKFSQAAMQSACAAAGWTTMQVFTDPNELFAVSLLAAE